MPNWCENELNITGPPSDILLLKERITGPQTGDEKPVSTDPVEEMAAQVTDALLQKDPDWPLDFHKIVPRPKTETDWYEWNCINWGTKWNASEPVISKQTTKSIRYNFSTAWSPPEPVILALAKMYPRCRITLRYWEGGVGFQGKLVVKGNEIISNSNSTYHGCRGG